MAFTGILSYGVSGDGIGIDSSSLEDESCNVIPACDAPGTGHVICAIRGTAIEQMEDSVSHVISKGQASKLIGRCLGMGVVLSQSQHTGHEVAPLSNHPAGTKQIVLGYIL